MGKIGFISLHSNHFASPAPTMQMLTSYPVTEFWMKLWLLVPKLNPTPYSANEFPELRNVIIFYAKCAQGNRQLKTLDGAELY
jgi:hypothetical protein